MNFLGQGFQNVEHCGQTDMQTDTQTDATENNSHALPAQSLSESIEVQRASATCTHSHRAALLLLPRCM